jgi:hypothetical protein
MREGFRIGLLVALAALWPVGHAVAKDELSKRDSQGAVSVIVTPAGPPAAGAPLTVTVRLDTHSVALDSIKFEEAVVLRGPNGVDVAPKVDRVSGGGHHREVVLSFPPLPGMLREVRITVKNVGGVAERSFAWAVPAAR